MQTTLQSSWPFATPWHRCVSLNARSTVFAHVSVLCASCAGFLQGFRLRMWQTMAVPQFDTTLISAALTQIVALLFCPAACLQSTKLCIHEERVLELVLETKHMPQAMAQHGTVNVTSEEVAQRIGQVFIQRVSIGECRATDLGTPVCDCMAA